MTGPVPFGPVHVERLTTDTDPWLSCDDCFDQLDVMVEASLRGSSRLPEPFRVHLLACAVCGEEARSLTALLAPELAMSEEEGVDRLERAIAGPAS
jgi:hypothetical protein